MVLSIMSAKAQVLFPAIETDSCMLQQVLDEYSASGQLSRGYYKDFLGEECIDFGTEKPYYNWQRDVTYVGMPLFLASVIVKEKKKALRSSCFDANGKYSTCIDDYTRFAPYALIVGLKASGVKGRSSWTRLTVSSLLANTVMAAAVKGTKHGIKEMRPDNSTDNSFPSGHTATAFVAATILHKEYGMTRSPWYSVGGYAVATATGMMRILNNRHWISDVMAGAGIGILSTELGYFLGDLIMGNRGTQHLSRNTPNPAPTTQHPAPNTPNPSFFDVQMGVGLHPGKIELTYEQPDSPNDFIDLGTSTSVGIEGAYFINKHLGFGGMARLTATPGKGLNSDIASIYNNEGNQASRPGISDVTIYDNMFTDASLDMGIYGNLPLGKHISIGGKLLVGARLSDGITYKATNAAALNAPEEYDILSVKVANSFNYVTGISCTWHYKPNFAWKLYADFDSAKASYGYSLNGLSDLAKQATAGKTHKAHASMFMNFFTIGGAFTVTM